MSRLYTLALPLLIACSDRGAVQESSASAADTQSVPITIDFRGDWTVVPNGTLAQGGKVLLKFDAVRAGSCKTSSINEWSTTAHYRINGGTIGSVEAAGLSPSNGTASREVVLAAVGDLEVWFETTNRFGCQSWDSNFGKNYHFVINLPANVPGWIGDGASVVSRDTCNNGQPCEETRVPLAQGFSFDTWARQRAAISKVYFDVWKAGVTDIGNVVLWKELDVQVHFRPAGFGEFQTRYVDFDSRQGNNARYGFWLRDIDPLPIRPGHSVLSKADCPKYPLGVSTDGQYVQVEGEFYMTVNGVDYRPAGGGAFKGKFSDYLGLYEVCLTT